MELAEGRSERVIGFPSKRRGRRGGKSPLHQAEAPRNPEAATPGRFASRQAAKKNF